MSNTDKHKHMWHFDGDDPYILCVCGERRDAISGKVVTSGNQDSNPPDNFMTGTEAFEQAGTWKPRNQDSQDEPTVAGSFFRRATMSAGDQPDGDDTWHISKKDWNTVMDEIEASWEAHTNRAVNEARIDELQNRLRVQFIPSHWERLRNETNSWAKYVDRRIAELTALKDKEEDQSTLESQ